MDRNIRLYPWFKFFQNLIFWQAVWFLFFQAQLSAADAILLYAVYDIATTVLEVPSGWLSDRAGRRVTLILGAAAGLAGSVLLVLGGSFWVFAAAQVCLGTGAALVSGTDSSLLYESLSREDRSDEIEAEEVRAWRFSFSALALSAFAGGAMSLGDPVLPFQASGLAGLAVLLIAIRFREPSGIVVVVSGSWGGLLSQPMLVWCFVLALSMYVFSHVPYVFGQPFMLEALSARGFSGETPLISGTVTATMMLVSVAASWAARGLRRRAGFGGTMLVALGLQVALIGILTASDHPLAIAFLALRMVPDALARPFLLARIQPLLSDRLRATYLSMQSLSGRLVLAASLILGAGDASREGAFAHGEMQAILVWYLAAGVAVLMALGLTWRAVR